MTDTHSAPYRPEPEPEMLEAIAEPHDPEQKLEAFKTHVVYLTGAAIALGGLLIVAGLIVFEYLDAVAGFGGIMLVIGGAAQFLFGQLQAKQTEQAVERAANSARNGSGSGSG